MRRAVNPGTTMTRLATNLLSGIASSPSSEEVVSNESSRVAGISTTIVVESDADRTLASAIAQRIETRLPGRVKNLSVQVTAGSVLLKGECATYYTKQLAQHAALGVIEDEQFENAIVVTVGR